MRALCVLVFDCSQHPRRWPRTWTCRPVLFREAVRTVCVYSCPPSGIAPGPATLGIRRRPTEGPRRTVHMADTVTEIDVDELAEMQREVNRGLMKHFINADLLTRAALDIRRSVGPSCSTTRPRPLRMRRSRCLTPRRCNVSLRRPLSDSGPGVVDRGHCAPQPFPILGPARRRWGARLRSSRITLSRSDIPGFGWLGPSTP